MKRILLIGLLLSTAATAQEKTFIREYTYNASEDDSRNSARTKAIEQVQGLLLQEVGLYVERLVQINETETATGNLEKLDRELKEFFQSEIKSVAAAITETKIIEEKWDGYQYYVKAQITVNPDVVVKRVNQAIESRVSNEEIERLRELLSKSETQILKNQGEIEALRQEFQAKQQGVETKEQEVAILKRKLEEANQQLKQLDAERQVVSSEVERIRKIILTKTKQAIDNISLGMTEAEVIKVAGQYRSRDTCATNIYLNYGQVWVIVESGVVSCIISQKAYSQCLTCGLARGMRGLIK